MIHPSLHINAILDPRNINAAMAFIWGSPKAKGFTISRKDLSQMAFSMLSNSKSESECEMLFPEPFLVSTLVEKLKEASEPCFAITGNGLRIHPEKYKEWKKLIFLNGQDIYVSACFGDSVGLDWSFSIPMESNILKVALSDGYAENHCHFSAAGPSFEINWALLHNGHPARASIDTITRKKSFFEEFYSLKDYYLFKNIAVLVIYLRRCVYCLNKDRSFTEISLDSLEMRSLSIDNRWFREKVLSSLPPCSASLLSSFESALNDYADSSGRNPLFGERELLCEAMKRFPGWNHRNQSIFYLYLLCKRYLRNYFIQSNSMYGFSNFKRFEQATSLFFPEGNKRFDKIVRELTMGAIEQSPGISRAEIRTAPKANLQMLRARIASMEPRGERSIPYSLILHFIKETYKPGTAKPFRGGNNLAPRCYGLIKNYQKQTSSIKKFAQSQRRNNLLPLVGIDAANREIRCRPEIFAPFYRELRYSRFIDDEGRLVPLGLHFTFHVGEDFISLVDGLRAIEEAIDFLDLSNGDRIGHASALGTDVSRYYLLKGRAMVQTKQDYLDDCCFLYKNILGLSGFEVQKSQLIHAINSLLLDIYGKKSLESYIRSYYLRGDHPDVHAEMNKRGSYEEAKMKCASTGHVQYVNHYSDETYKRAWEDEESLSYIHLYHYSKSVREKGEETVLINLNDEFLDAIEAAQKALVKKIMIKDIGVETNPTSNYLIGPFDDFEDIPALSMIGLDENKKYYRGLRLSVGTDDPGLFGINLYNEYGSVLYSLQQSGLASGHVLIEEIRSLARSSLDLSFDKS